MEKKKVIIGMAALVILAIALVSLNLTGNIVKQDSIKIGGLFGLSGYSVSWGEPDMKGALLAIEEANAEGGINGKQIEFIIEDTKSDFTQTAIAYNKLVEVDKPIAVIGPTWTEFAEVIMPLVEENMMVTVSGSVGADFIDKKSDYFFSTWPSIRFEMKYLTQFMKQNGKDKVAIIYDQNSWSKSVRDGFVEKAKENGINISGEYVVDGQSKDFRSVILKIKNSNADSILISFGEIGDTGIFMKQAYEMNSKLPVFATSNTESELLKSNYGQYMNGITYAFPEITSKYAEFEAKYEKRFGKKPSTPNAATSYDMTLSLIGALKKNPKNSDELVYFIKEQEFEGASNDISFDDKGNIKDKSFVIKTFRSGSFVKV